MLIHDTAASICRVGLAAGDVTPPADIYHRMWGAASHDRATGVHQELTATALALGPSGEANDTSRVQVVIALDHCLLWEPEMHDMLEFLAGATGLEPAQFAIAFSHTHAAGLMDCKRAGLPGGELIPEYLTALATQMSDLVNTALQRLMPATITYATGRCNLARNRDLWDEDSGQFVCGFNPAGRADDTVLVARVSDAAGASCAVIVNYACHPTTLAWQNTLISPDFPGTMRQVVIEATGCRCVFLQGASGDLGPRDGYVGDLETAQRNGRQLGFAVLAALESMPPADTRYVYTGPVISGATLGTWEYQNLDEPARQRKRSWNVRRLEIPLDYRADLAAKEQIEAEHDLWQQREQAAQGAGDYQAAADARAMVERMRRRLTRAANLPPGPAFPLPVTLLRIGDAVWVFVEGEHYQLLQTQLRQAFSDNPVLVCTLTNGSRCSYLPRADCYGKGIYQETVAILGAGCLEKTIGVLTEEIRGLLGT